MDRIGRKWTILVGCALTAAGIGVQMAANDWKEFLAGRLVNGECAPHTWAAEVTLTSV